MIIRQEQPKDYKEVEQVTREAFWNLYFPGCSEHLAVHKIRKSEDFIPELTFIIEENEKILGSIFYSKSKIVTKDKEEIKTITFGPVSIYPSKHRQGYGRKLITHSIEVAKTMGHRAIITLGYDYHYKPYGFVDGKDVGICLPNGSYTGVLVLPLYSGALDGITGCVEFTEALETPRHEVEAFDKTFPYKKKEILPSQYEYEKMISQL
ncbi:GNAT family N-acetyltransferase [Candidatus Epulonipiscium fishelsonii]|uniref:GNAT family N-acetyltransferase n=1 Tax=Candidatus Epulonipiscium fishelsonii TaxID=77094 RepID=A0ACC8X7A6_9FIRM|nr:GNAT family N-acetyltransferase [Epulopiscium sp. SCG-B11WGA-EpuloA1]ONI42678.1 GNAT family N-acetyltransferase [Epulopiscium sp. SCG-B05WGA-EpuloA1]